MTGPSGCGKSTLLSVVLGLRLPDAGSVTLGGVDLVDLDLVDWRRRIGWVPQRPHLFARSVAENVRLGRPDASEHAVAAALEAAGLTEVVRRLTAGRGHTARRGRGGALGRRAPAGVPGPCLRAGRTAAPARRAHREPGRRDRGRRARRGAPPDRRPHRGDRGPPTRARRPRRTASSSSRRRWTSRRERRPRRHRPDPWHRARAPVVAWPRRHSSGPARSARRSPSWGHRPG